MISTISSQRGFGLLEILITVFILGVGLLGLAGLQATSLSFNHSAYNRSQATILAYDIIDRMRANPTAISNYTGTPTQTATCLAVAGCNPTQMALHDLWEWQNNIDAILSPGAKAAGAVGTITANGVIFNISISWDENKDGAIDDDDPDFKVSFQP